jgi:hypothetical protein
MAAQHNITRFLELAQQNAIVPDTNFPILIYTFRPENCSNCNALLSRIYADSTIQRFFSKNIYWLLNGIRDIEAKDAKVQFTRVLGHDVQIINDESMYMFFKNQDIAGLLNETNGCIVIHRGQVYFFDLKEFDLSEKIMGAVLNGNFK